MIVWISLGSKSWVDALETYQNQYNTGVHRSLGTNVSPFEIFFGRKINFNLEILESDDDAEVDDIDISGNHIQGFGAYMSRF